MGKEIISFVDIEIEKHTFYCYIGYFMMIIKLSLYI